MSSIAQHPASALEARVAALVAESLAPVPRASHIAAVDVDHLALVVDYVAEVAAAAQSGRRAPVMSAGTAIAYQRLETAIRGYARTAA
jgi:ABC-type glutathione transport system ATPase component